MKGLSRRRLTGAFVDDALEAAFREEHFSRSVRRFTQFSLSLSAAVFLLYGVHDVLIVPQIKSLAWLLRYGVFAPVAVATIAFAYTRGYARYHQYAVFLFGVAVNVVVLGIAVTAGGNGFFIYTSYAILFVTLGPFIAKMNVVTQALYTAVTVVLFNILNARYSHAPQMVSLSIHLTLVSMGSIGTLLAYQLDVDAREAFIQRRLLDEEKGKSESLLLNILPASVAERLKENDSSIADGFTHATVLFSDIVGFTKMSDRLPPAEVVKRLNAIFSAFDVLTDHYGLEKIKTIGDAYMVAGGVPDPRSDHARAIADMALDMQVVIERVSAEIGEDLRIRIGIHSGPVVAGVIGKKKFIYDVWGDTVNTASRMESHGEPGRIQVSSDTAALLEGRFDLEARGDIEVKGKGTMTTYFLVGRKGRSSAVLSTVRGAEAPVPTTA